VTELWKERVSAGVRLSLPNTAGIMRIMSDVVSLPTWLTYQQVAQRLGLRSASAAAARAEVCVPADLLAAGPQKPRERLQPTARPADGTTLVEAVAVAVAPLQAVIETLSRELSAARVTNDALRDQLTAAHSEAAELRGKSAANEAALEREFLTVAPCSSK
jgi:hypothetical protein